MARVRQTFSGMGALAPMAAVAIIVLLSQTGSAAADEDAVADPNKAHEKVYLASPEGYPSATECGECHPTQYRQWSVSQHAYAQLSPVFNTMQGAIASLTNGTLGDFCERCHNQVGIQSEGYHLE